MATLLTNFDEIKAEIHSLYGGLLETANLNKFLKQTSTDLTNSLEALDLLDNEKAQFLLSFHSENTKITLSQTFDQAMKIIDLGLKLPKEVAILDAELILKAKQASEIDANIALKNQQKAASIAEVSIAQAQSVADLTIKSKQANELDAKADLITEQKNEVVESILDRKQKRAPEITILNKQASLIDEQINKLKKDIDYINSQKTSMIEQVADNRKIKAMDSIGDMIATLGNGGLVPSTAMFGTYFGLSTSLTGQAAPGDYTVTKI